MARISRIAVAAVLAATTLLLPTGPMPAPAVFAHCPGTSAHDYAQGTSSLTIQANGVRADIDWTQGNVCSSGVSHWVNVCRTGACDHWAQVGWRYYSGYAEPRMYCEWAGGQYKIVEFSITHATHAYKMDFDTLDNTWDCYRDGTFKYTYSEANAGFDSGTYLIAAGEAHQKHVQIGRMAPAKLLFADMQYQRESDGQWPTMNINVQATVDPYGIDEPAVQMRVWTNAH